MADSVDRVFSHALSTVTKIRTGTVKPPADVRLRLYGLYKQAMEGDVEGMMPRPVGSGEEAERAREKWDAWYAQRSLARTEAKRRYIDTLIRTMRAYAAPEPEAQELVDELEFVWDQVRSNVASAVSGTGSSPGHDDGPDRYQEHEIAVPVPGVHSPPPILEQGPRTDSGLRILRPGESVVDQGSSAAPGDGDAGMETEGEEEFVDAKDSQYNPIAATPNRYPSSPRLRPRPLPSASEPTFSHPSPYPDSRQQNHLGFDRSIGGRRPPPPERQRSTSSSPMWRRRVETALITLTAEVAALREQLEARRLVNTVEPALTRRRRLVKFIKYLWSWVWRGLVFDLAVILLVGLWWAWRRRSRTGFLGRMMGGLLFVGGEAEGVRRVGFGLEGLPFGWRVKVRRELLG